MIVSQILKAKADVGVIAVKPDSSVSEAVSILSEKRIGTLVVSKKTGSLDGILSERDIVRELGRHGVALMAEPVSKIMTSKLVTCTPADTADSVLEMMTAGKSHLEMDVADAIENRDGLFSADIIGFTTFKDYMESNAGTARIPIGQLRAIYTKHTHALPNVAGGLKADVAGTKIRQRVRCIRHCDHWVTQWISET